MSFLIQLDIVCDTRHKASAFVCSQGETREVRPRRRRLAEIPDPSEISDLHWYQVRRQDPSNTVRREQSSWCVDSLHRAFLVMDIN